VLRNRVYGVGTESGESGCYIGGDFNRLTNNVVAGCGAHGFYIAGDSNILANCYANKAAVDGFHIEGNGDALLPCAAMLCSGKGLDNGGTGILVDDCLFKRNRLDVANDGTFSNAGTFLMDTCSSLAGRASCRRSISRRCRGVAPSGAAPGGWKRSVGPVCTFRAGGDVVPARLNEADVCQQRRGTRVGQGMTG
jgi:hypothetical protein